MDAIELLKTDHRKVEKLFDPAAKNVAPTRDLVLESIEEHKQIKLVLADLEQADKSTDEWRAGLKVLMEDVQHHVGEEENDLFPRVKDKVLSKDELEDLGKRMEAMKTQHVAAARAR